MPVPLPEGAEWIWAIFISSLAGLVRMGKSQKALPPQVRAWVEARKRYHLTHAQVQMARESG